MRRSVAVIVIGVALGVGGCSSSSSDQVNPTTSRPLRTAAALSFREVEHVTQARNTRCAGARRYEVLLPDRQGQHCYVLGIDDVVQSAPLINPGIAGRDIEISSNLSKTDAVALAAKLRGVDPSGVRVETNSG
jgi:hypothetical protein